MYFFFFWKATAFTLADLPVWPHSASWEVTAQGQPKVMLLREAFSVLPVRVMSLPLAFLCLYQHKPPAQTTSCWAP